jgi:hypothetical protein
MGFSTHVLFAFEVLATLRGEAGRGVFPLTFSLACEVLATLRGEAGRGVIERVISYFDELLASQQHASSSILIYKQFNCWLISATVFNEKKIKSCGEFF